MERMTTPRNKRVNPLVLIPIAGAVLAGCLIAAVRRTRRSQATASAELRRFRHAFESSPVGMIVLAPDSRFLVANPAYCEMVGYTERELLHMSALELTHPDDRAVTYGVMRELLAGKPRVTGVEERYVTRAGGVVWTRVSASIARDKQGQAMSYVAAVENTTERKANEEARAALTRELERMNAILNTVFDKAPVGLGVWDRELRFVRINQALAAMNGIPMESHIGRTIQELLPDLEPVVARLFRHVLETGEALINREVSGITPADPGRLRHWNTSYFPIRLEGEIAGAGVVCEEITEKKSSEERMRQMAKLESIGVLAGGIAHDFNNLLTGILGNASLLAADMPHDAPGIALVHGVMHAGERAADLTRQLLAYAGKGRFVVQPLDVSAMVKEIAGLIDVSGGRNVELVLNLAPDLPVVEADHGQLQQIIMNLAINAAEAIGEGCTGTLTISTGLQTVDESTPTSHFVPGKIETGRYVSIEVRDTGSGMDAQTLSRIFDPFFTTKFMGRGLGLSAVLGIIGSHRGGMKVSSIPGQGSVFQVLLPAGPDRPARPAAVQEKSSLMSNGTVLVVDDEAVVRQMARVILERYGYTVMSADDGARGVALFREHVAEIDVVLLDMTMPVLSGEDALREMQKIAPDVNVVLSSGHSETEAVRRFAGYGLAGFIQKPYTAAQLAEKVKSVLTSGVI
ncbi:MAG: Chemotaxis protein methyltransferase CheR [Bryobacterales bacterium]|nr:Chemotaxis protein methyltransferase CheR [Bryobacterales bacterium]